MPIQYIPINELLDQVGNLPPMPQVAQKALHIIQDPDASMSELASVIKLDQAISSLILRWVNSGYYSLRGKISSVEQAITYLGLRTVQNLVIAASVASYMNKPIPGYALEKGDLWKHSVAMASGANAIMKEIDSKQAEDAYYAGLFCDVGKLAFDILMRNPKVNLEEKADRPFQEVEQNLFGYDHATIGAAIVFRWNLPEFLVNVIQNHHTPSKAKEEYRLLAYAVHAADAVVMMLGVGIGRDGLQYELDPHTLEILKWDDAQFARVVEKISVIVEQTEAYLRSGS